MQVHFNINKIFEIIGSPLTYENLNVYLKTNYNGKIFVKEINDKLLLVYNNFINKSDSNLYNECRSLVIQTGTNPQVISYTHDNIEYLKISEYENKPDDKIDESFEGTVVSIFSYEGVWYFTTSRCVSIDQSYYYDKTKNFGVLFDECLSKELGINSRDELTAQLNPTVCYYWVIVHHANKYLIDYTERFGFEYTKLIHISAKKQSTQQNIYEIELPQGIIQPQKFESYQQGLDWITRSTCTEGLVIQRLCEITNKTLLYKIHTDKYWLLKSHNPNYPNRWYAYLDIFKRNDSSYKIKDYQNENSIIENIIIDDVEIDISGMIYLLYKGTADQMYNIVVHFTYFNHKNNLFEKINSHDYELIKNSKYKVLRKQLSTLQSLILKQTINSASDVITHLRKYVSVEDFVGLMGCIEGLGNEPSVKYLSNTNKKYKQFLLKYLENIKSH